MESLGSSSGVRVRQELGMISGKIRLRMVKE